MLRNVVKLMLTLFFNQNQYLEICRILKYGLFWKRKSLKREDKKVDLLDYENAMLAVPNSSRLFYNENKIYGLEDILERYSGYQKRICSASEHGFFIKRIPYFGIYSDLPAIITFGEFRKEVLQKQLDCMVLKIGPYIHYAKEIWDEGKIEEVKKKNGKTLLVFPAHTIENTSYDKKDYDFIRVIKEYKEKYNFATVIISMYFVDIMKNEHVKYQKEGFLIFSAGHRNNFDFLDRLKTVFCLTDYVLSEGMGTHVGYSVYMNKPITIENIYYEIKDTSENYIGESGNEVKNIEVRETYNKIIKPFIGYHTCITKEQLEICNYYFGNFEIKSPEKLYECFCFIEKVYNRSLFNGKSYHYNAEKELKHCKYSQEISDLVKTNRYYKNPLN